MRSALLRVAHDPLALLDLTLLRCVLAPGERILAFLEHDVDGRALELEAFAEEVLEIAPVAIGDVTRAAAVDHDRRRIRSTRMRKLQLRRVTADERRLIALVGLL